MKSKSIFLIGVSLAFGLVAAIGITQVMGRKSNEPVKTVEKVAVLVAVSDLDINTELQPEMFKVEEWPLNLVPDGVATNLEEIENKVVTSRVGKRGPIYVSNLVNKSDLRIKKIPAGYKVIGIKLGADNHVNGLLEPGDLVDLIGVFKARGRSGGSTSKTFLRKIRVFSIAARMTKDVERDPSAKGDVIVGLLVNEKQSEQIVLVQKVADLQLAMRSTEESNEVEVDDDFDFGSSSKTASNNPFAGILKFGNKGNQPSGDNHTMVVYTSEGPTSYHFNLNPVGGRSSVPKRVEGFEEEKKEEEKPKTEDESKKEEFEEDSADKGSKPFINDLDSEPED